jgi:signal peptidase II
MEMGPVQGTRPEGHASGAGEPVGERNGTLARRRAGGWIRVVLVLVIVVAVDQVTKHAVRHSIVQGEERKLLPGIELVSTRNRGVAFGLFPGDHIVVTILIALALVALVVYFARHAADRLIWLPTGMLLGGALGNIIDRVRDGSVTDFIKLPLGWPPFNLADTSIVVGVVLLFLVIDHQRRPSP